MLRRRDLLALSSSLAFQPKPDRPNLLFLMADQHRGDCLGAEGNRAIQTPHLDRLAKEGARFRCAYTSTPSCTPARAGLLTGMSPWQHGMLGYNRVADQYAVEKPRVLREAGYYTAVIGKLHYSPQRHLHGYDWAALDESGREESVDFRSDYRAWFASEAPGLNPDATGLGFNDYDAKSYALPERLHPTTWTGGVATRFIENYSRPQPFFLKVSFARPHSPYDPPARWMRHYDSVKLPAAQTGDWAQRFAPKSSDRSDLWHGDLGAEQVRRSRAGYYGAISFVDEQIGRILGALEKRGQLENTLIIYTSDHGDMTGDHHLWRKSYAYEASARVPMLMRWPKGMLTAQRGQVFQQPVELRDILPTLADAAGRSVSEACDGRSLLELIRRKGAGWRETLDLEHDVTYGPENHWNALTDGRMKYIFHARDGEEHLFDLAADAHELRNLASHTAHGAALREWRSRMIAHLSVRGERWVKNGNLALRPTADGLGPLYPRPKKA